MIFTEVIKKDTFQIVAGWLGNALALFFFISPIFLIINLYKEKIKAKDVPYILLIANVMNCVLWTAYGVLKNDNQVWIINGTGGVLNVIWLCIYWVFFFEYNYRIYIPAQIASIYFVFTVWENFFWLFPNAGQGTEEEKNDFAINIAGNVAMVFNIIMYASPGQKILDVCKTGRYQLIPIFTTIIALFCSTCWLIYGIYSKAVPIIVPNGLGIINI